MKAKKAHRVPLPDAAVALLQPLHETRSGNDAYVFPGRTPRRPLTSNVMLQVLHRIGRDDLTVHGFRATFSTWVAEATTTPAELRELQLAHAVADKVAAAYQRSDMFAKRRQLADDWARHCIEPPAATAEIISFRA